VCRFDLVEQFARLVKPNRSSTESGDITSNLLRLKLLHSESASTVSRIIVSRHTHLPLLAPLPHLLFSRCSSTATLFPSLERPMLFADQNWTSLSREYGFSRHPLPLPFSATELVRSCRSCSVKTFPMCSSSFGCVQSL
jgi:hypothetical protein